MLKILLFWGGGFFPSGCHTCDSGISGSTAEEKFARWPGPTHPPLVTSVTPTWKKNRPYQKLINNLNFEPKNKIFFHRSFPCRACPPFCPLRWPDLEWPATCPQPWKINIWENRGEFRLNLLNFGQIRMVLVTFLKNERKLNYAVEPFLRRQNWTQLLSPG